mgnify:CR=1 FL=1
MVKRLTIILLITTLLLSGCLPGKKDSDLTSENKEGKKEKVDVSTKINTEENYYRTVLPYKPGQSRGLVNDWVENRLDVDELETGLMRMSQSEFDPDDYVYQDGQYLTKKKVRAWLQRKSERFPEGLNKELSTEGMGVEEKLEAYKQNPAVVSYILEQNYLKQKGDQLELKGISIGIALNSKYTFQVQDDAGLLHFGDVKISDQKLEEEGKRAAEEIVKRMREDKDIPNVPIIVALFKEETKESLTPGNFILKTKANASSATLNGWNKVNEKNILFPSKEANEFDPAMSRTFNNIKGKIGDYFPTYVGVIGRGHYENNELKRLTIDIPIQFYGKSEVIAFTQYVADIVSGMDNYMSIQVYISSVDKQEAVIVREAGDGEPTVHIYY